MSLSSQKAANKEESADSLPSEKVSESLGQGSCGFSQLCFHTPGAREVSQRAWDMDPTLSAYPTNSAHDTQSGWDVDVSGTNVLVKEEPDAEFLSAKSFTCFFRGAGTTGDCGKDECSAIASPPAGSVFICASIRLGASMTPEQFVGVYTHTHTHTHTHIVHTHIRMYMYTCIHRPRPQHIPANDCG